jgi:hypothetical protein
MAEACGNQRLAERKPYLGEFTDSPDIGSDEQLSYLAQIDRRGA